MYREHCCSSMHAVIIEVDKNKQKKQPMFFLVTQRSFVQVWKHIGLSWNCFNYTFFPSFKESAFLPKILIYFKIYIKITSMMDLINNKYVVVFYHLANWKLFPDRRKPWLLPYTGSHAWSQVKHRLRREFRISLGNLYEGVKIWSEQINI